MISTKTAAAVIWLALATASSGQSPATPPETFRLSYADGDWSRATIIQSAVYREADASPASDRAPAKETRQSRNAGFEVELRRTSKNADGSMNIEATYRRKWREALREGEAAAAADYSRVPGRTLTFRLGADGNVTALEGFEGFPEVVDPITGQPIDRRDFAADIGHLFPRLPDHPISVGSTWDAPEVPDALRRSGQEPPMLHYQVLARVRRNEEDCLKIVASRTARRASERPGPGGETQQVDSNYGRIDVSFYSLRRGMFVEKSISFQNVAGIRQGTRAVGETALLALYECAVTFD